MNNKQAFMKGIMVTFPMMVGGMPFGILFGSLAMSYDLSPWFAIAMSGIVFAGSAQFVALGLIYIDAPLWVIISTTFIVNLRHILYAADMVKFVKHLSIKWRMLLGFWLVDESYAAIRPMYSREEVTQKNGHYAYLGSSLAFYSMWLLCTVIGVVAGELFPSISEWGMEFAIVATFVSIVTPYLKKVPHRFVSPYWVALLVSSISSIFLHNLPNNLGLLVATLLGVTSGFYANKLVEQMQEGS